MFHLLRNIGSSFFISLSIAEIVRTTGANYSRMTEMITPYSQALTMPIVTGGWNFDTVAGACQGRKRDYAPVGDDRLSQRLHDVHGDVGVGGRVRVDGAAEEVGLAAHRHRRPRSQRRDGSLESADDGEHVIRRHRKWLTQLDRFAERFEQQAKRVRRRQSLRLRALTIRRDGQRQSRRAPRPSPWSEHMHAPIGRRGAHARELPVPPFANVTCNAITSRGSGGGLRSNSRA